MIDGRPEVIKLKFWHKRQNLIQLFFLFCWQSFKFFFALCFFCVMPRRRPVERSWEKKGFILDK